jgi:hypothetical protein
LLVRKAASCATPTIALRDRAAQARQGEQGRAGTLANVTPTDRLGATWAQIVAAAGEAEAAERADGGQ